MGERRRESGWKEKERQKQKGRESEKGRRLDHRQ
jgi:hypothetical protein